MFLTLHAGHNNYAKGAVGFLDEVVENRKVLLKLKEILNKAGFNFTDCTDLIGKTANQNLKNICDNCNEVNADLNISIHLNSGRRDNTGDGKTGGVEVWGWDNNTKEIGEKICKNISEDLKITNRGYKINTGYYILKHTVKPTIIVECCFVDDKDDFYMWNPDICANAIAKALGINNITKELKVGDIVKVKKDGTENNKDYVLDKNNVKNRLYYSEYQIMQISGDNVLIGNGNTVTCWINKNKIL